MSHQEMNNVRKLPRRFSGTPSLTEIEWQTHIKVDPIVEQELEICGIKRKESLHYSLWFSFNYQVSSTKEERGRPQFSHNISTQLTETLKSVDLRETTYFAHRNTHIHDNSSESLMTFTVVLFKRIETDPVKEIVQMERLGSWTRTRLF